MSIANIAPYFREKLEELNYEEIPEAFWDGQEPSTSIEKGFHLELLTSSNILKSGILLELEIPLTLRLFFKGYDANIEARDEAVKQSEIVLIKLLNPETRYTIGGGVTGITLQNMTILPIADSNDNTVILQLDFNIKANIGTDC